MSEQRQTYTLPVKGMTCAACATSIEKTLNKQSGVASAEVNYATNTVLISLSDQVKLSQLKKAVKKSGYDLLLEGNDDQSKGTELKQLRNQLTLALPVTAIIVVLSMFIGPFAYKNLVLLILTLPVLFWSGFRFYRSAFHQLGRLSVNMDTLIATGTGSAFVFSLIVTFFPHWLTDQGQAAHVYYESAAVIISFILLGKYLEERAKSKTSSAIEKLYSLNVKTVIKLVGDSQTTIRIEEVEYGDLLLIKAGERIPVDGLVIEGNSTIDESMLTGESVPVDKTEGEFVKAGTLNQTGILTVKAEKLGAETVLGQIIKMVSEAMGSKAPAQKLADKIASVFVPIVLLLAVITFCVWYFVMPDSSLTLAFVNTFNVLIIACPCALGLATPTALMVGIGKAASKGILIKNAIALEMAKQIKKLFLDKTGTISKGKLEVVSSERFFPEDETLELMSILNGMESSSNHPIAQAIVDDLNQNYRLFPFQIAKVDTLPGVGLSTEIDGHHFEVTGLDKSRRQLLSDNQSQLIKSYQEAGHSIVLFWKDGQLKAVFGLKDTLKGDSRVVISSLQKKGLEVEILSGDHESAVASIAYAVGIDAYQAGLMPADKASIVEASQKGNVVGFAGDGINDAPALAKADLSIAMSTGTDIAIESADVTLMSGDLAKIADLIRISVQTVRTMNQNLFWAFIYNIVAIPVAAGVLIPVNGFMLNPMIAGAAMAFSSLSVVLNSLRLKAMK
ncbi:cation-translocating P-type ATPase [Roseivirga sp. E12]|uniref:heavy metal translocating P-type ATPase n=1 Tax=Roseivirga sp. E12 TaxID=2819237 RepID=UPI001ABCC79C|nr:heavy metal translocating P-type ATPase [Roseivirga sp. E12]MBO3699939.1 copper-translocating P-type ATPase [Roseivirga sp. E12]